MGCEIGWILFLQQDGYDDDDDYQDGDPGGGWGGAAQVAGHTGAGEGGRFWPTHWLGDCAVV